MRRTLDAGPSIASRRSDHASSARLKPPGGVTDPARSAKPSRTNDALISRPRTPGIMSFEDDAGHESARPGREPMPAHQIALAPGEPIERVVERRLVRCRHPF